MASTLRQKNNTHKHTSTPTHQQTNKQTNKRAQTHSANRVREHCRHKPQRTEAARRCNQRECRRSKGLCNRPVRRVDIPGARVWNAKCQGQKETHTVTEYIPSRLACHDSQKECCSKHPKRISARKLASGKNVPMLVHKVYCYQDAKGAMH